MLQPIEKKQTEVREVLINNELSAELLGYLSEVQLVLQTPMPDRIFRASMQPYLDKMAELPFFFAYLDAAHLSKSTLQTYYHIQDVVKKLETDSLHRLFFQEYANFLQVVVRTAAFYHDFGKRYSLGKDHPDYSVWIYQQVQSKVQKTVPYDQSDFFDASVIALIKTHHAFESFRAMFNAMDKRFDLLIKLSGEMGCSGDICKNGFYTDERGVFHLIERIIKAFKQDEVNPEVFYERYPVFNDKNALYVAYLLNQADVSASDNYQFLLSVNRVIVSHLLEQKGMNIWLLPNDNLH